MTWKCVDCNTPETTGPARPEDRVVVDAVCHHCGRPICRKNRFLIADVAFSAAAGPAAAGMPSPAASFHCKECYRKHHDRAQAFDELAMAAVAFQR